MLNWGLLKHPLNWITVFLMVFIGIIVMNLLLSPWHIPQKNTDELGANSQTGPWFGTSVLASTQ